MSGIALLLGNNAPIEVHAQTIKVNEEGEAILDSEGNATRAWGNRSRGTRHENWKGRGTFKVYELDPTTSPHTEIHIDESKIDGDDWIGKILREISHGWDYHSNEAPGWVTVADDGGDAATAELIRNIVSRNFGISEPGPETITNLVTSAGIDKIAAQISGTASATAVVKYCGLTANATAPSTADTTLTAEIVTAGGGLIRAAGTYAHTTGATTYTISNTFTANGSDALPVSVAKVGYFDAATVGNLVYEDALSAAITFNASGDVGTITETVTL